MQGILNTYLHTVHETSVIQTFIFIQNVPLELGGHSVKVQSPSKYIHCLIILHRILDLLAFSSLKTSWSSVVQIIEVLLYR